MTKYREIIRLTGLGFSQRNIMASCGVSQKTVVKVQKRARELNISWPLDESMTDTELQKLMFSKESKVSASKKMPDYAYIRKELLKNGVNKKLFLRGRPNCGSLEIRIRVDALSDSTGV